MTEKLAIRAWCCEMQWPGRKPFIFGTVYMENKDQIAAVESALIARFNEKMTDILPVETPLPKIVKLMPGAIFFVSEGEF
ncbi:hypothetical protein RCKEEF_85 [Rhodobacter phage RcKeef]|nr:hypothetical protein RCSALEM_86 [Rhodobacter phage RcSalem]UUV43354.1 hypothetical protein RCDORA_85 [Rhodobacter phage RcDora]UUV43725.1 hypothetical protein RCKEEF_85 [Rhodobacter phage RcKeef]UUV44757.1 hypothetical protein RCPERIPETEIA_86 [Rhodobacter phage RcPeripeteia]UUV45006.1 hypothetical protein RCWATA_85 [Rhodobacter phage RcWata]UUV45105.1 hypothetical protein RCWHITEOAK_87 [Rhodobacter phage RcWhiteOak]